MGWAALVVCLLIQGFGLYSPSVPGPAGVPGLDKVGHVLAFAIPAALAWLLQARVMIALLVLHALVSEPLQHAIAPSRQADFWDAVANLVGLALGWWVAATILRLRRHHGGMTSSIVQER